MGGHSLHPAAGLDRVGPRDEYPAWHTHDSRPNDPDRMVVDELGHSMQFCTR